MVSVVDSQSARHDLRVARLGNTPAVAFARFTGHGVEWAEAEMKQDRFAVDAAAPGARPDLTGLSCRWKPIYNTLGCILSLIIGPAAEAGADAGASDMLVGQIIGLFDADGRGSHPIPKQGPDFGWPPKGLELEARAAASDGKRRKEKFKIALVSTIGWVLFKTGWKTKNFDPAHYRRMTGLNVDFRKFDNVLRMTVDCIP